MSVGGETGRELGDGLKDQQQRIDGASGIGGG